MRICGIIAEFNPFHNGHAHIIKKIRELYDDTVIIAIMSGSFTQRGEVAVLDKWTRAKLAIENGCDMAFELPFAYATRSGEFFATGAIKILNKLHITDSLAFGSETYNLALLKNIAHQLDDTKTQKKIHAEVLKGASYAQGLSSAFGKEASILTQPNTILAVEYLRAIERTNSKITPILIERKMSNHNDKNLCGAVSSASAIREELKKNHPDFDLIKKVVPCQTFSEIQDVNKLRFAENIFKPLLAKIYTANFRNMREIYGINEGLENRILTMAKTSANLNEFINNTCSKRYSKSRISRALTHILLNFTKDAAKKIDESDDLYARLLAFNSVGAKILHSIKEKSQIPIIEKTTHFINEKALYDDFENLSPLQLSLAFDIRATNLQSLACNTHATINRDFTTPPTYIV